MLTEPQLIAYVEGTLSPDERAQVEAALAQDESLRRRVLEQMRLDAALRAALGPKANERVKQSVLAILRGESEAALKRQVAAAVKPRPFNSWITGAQEITRRFTTAATGRWAFAGATAALVLFVWFGTVRSGRTQVELPSLVQANDAQVVRDGTPSPWSANYVARAGDELRVSPSNSGTIRFADGTALHLEPATRLIVGDVTRARRTGGKQITLLAGALSAAVAKQSPGRPLLIHTPHATATVLGTEFDLSVGTNQTRLEVTEGAVALAGRAGEFAVASPQAAPRAQPLARNPIRWPFSSTSPWNTSLGAGAQFEPVAARSFLADGPLTEVLIPRHPFRGGPADPLRGVWVRGELRADVRFAADALLPEVSEPIVFMQPARRYALELLNVRPRAHGDLDADDFAQLDLAGPGAGQPEGRVRQFGFSALGGIIREGELQQGIPHALAARLEKSRLNVQPPGGGVCVWPATNAMRAPPQNGEATGNIHIGSLLALPPGVDVAALGLPPSALVIARALQDYGVYVTGPGPRPFALLSEGRMTGGEVDAAMNRLVPLLQVVTNNTAATPGGGGQPRRPAAPRFPNETK